MNKQVNQYIIIGVGIALGLSPLRNNPIFKAIKLICTGT